MKKTMAGIFGKALFAAALVCAGFASAETRTEALRKKLASDDRNYVFVAMHRGDWRNFPENSADAIRASIEYGADIVEIDVRMTKDGRFVLVHDDNVARVSNGKGKVQDLTLEEIKKLRMTFKGKETEYRILTLEEALDIARGKALLNLDKFESHPKEMLDAVAAAGGLREVLVKSTHPADTAKKLFGHWWENVESGEILYMPVVRWCWGSHKRAEKMLPGYLALDPRPNSMYEMCFDDMKYVAEPMEKLRKSPGAPRIWINTMWDSLSAGHSDPAALVEPAKNWGWWIDNGATMLQTDTGPEMIIYLEKTGRHTL